MIQPTVGRVVLFHHCGGLSHLVSHGPVLACLIAHVWNDRLINVGGFDSNGMAFGRTSVRLLQDDDVAGKNEIHATWMPYQKGQAAKTEALEQALKDGFTKP
jgi:hypothetical protein